MRVLGIDPASKCGWAVVEDADASRVASGVWRGDRLEGGGVRLAGFSNWLQGLLDQYRPGAIVVEAPIHYGGRAPNWTSPRIGGIALAAAQDRGLCWVEVLPSVLKKWATGKGNADKAAMVRAARSRLPEDCGAGGIDLKDDNEADALLLALYGAQELEW